MSVRLKDDVRLCKSLNMKICVMLTSSCVFFFKDLCWGKVPSVNTRGYHYRRRRNTLFKQEVYT